MSSHLSLLNPRLPHLVLALSVVAGLIACTANRVTPAPEPATSDVRNEPGERHQPDPVSLEGWQAETFALPPGFAPELPTGSESLLFPPGWRDPGAENFWSYAFVMRINEPAPDAARVDALLEKYYNGLLAAFAAGKQDLSATPARVDVQRTAPSRYEARMRLIDAFATFQPIDVRVLVDTVAQPDARSIMCVRVSRQPREHAIWRSLDAAITNILSRDAAAR